jgi:hypothetical protein
MGVGNKKKIYDKINLKEEFPGWNDFLRISPGKWVTLLF